MNIKINRSVSVVATFTAEDWQLYTESFPDEELATVAFELNRALEQAVASSKSSWEAHRKMMPAMRKMSDYGACDSEPMYFIELVLNQVFKD